MKTRSITKLALLAFAGTSLLATGVVADIPNPGDVTVTRDNYQRIIGALSSAGLSDSEIRRWMNAAKNNPDKHGTIPDPTKIHVTRENYKRIVNALSNLGLNRREIRRWMNASRQAHSEHPHHRREAGMSENPETMPRADNPQTSRENQARVQRVGNRVQPVVRGNRPEATTRPARVQRPARIQRPVQITRPQRPSRPARPGG